MYHDLCQTENRICHQIAHKIAHEIAHNIARLNKWFPIHLGERGVAVQCRNDIRMHALLNYVTTQPISLSIKRWEIILLSWACSGAITYDYASE
jgi:hypothetical protein